jgi:hypothetical protein
LIEWLIQLHITDIKPKQNAETNTPYGGHLPPASETMSHDDIASSFLGELLTVDITVADYQSS